MNKKKEKPSLPWWDEKNCLFSRICGEDFTNAEVVLTHIGVCLLLLVAILANI